MSLTFSDRQAIVSLCQHHPESRKYDFSFQVVLCQVWLAPLSEIPVQYTGVYPQHDT